MRFLQLAAILAVATHEAVAQQSGPDPPVFFFTKFPTSTREYRDKLIEMFSTNAASQCAGERGTSKYAVAIPRGGGDNLTMYSIEQYRDDAQFYEHLAAPSVAKMFGYIGERPDFWGKAGVDSRNFTVIDNMNFVKEGYAKAADPWLVEEDLTYASNDTAVEALPQWGKEVETLKAQENALAFGVYADPVNKAVLHLIHAYTTEAAFTAAQKQQQEGFLTGVKPMTTATTILQKAGGYLYQDLEGKACG